MQTDRQRWMAVLARASAPELERLLAHCEALPEHTVLRGPEAGLAMVRGRIGGGGAPFNLGEMTVARCTVRSAAGQVGHATVIGHDGRHALLAAVIDAALQEAPRPDLHQGVLAPLAEAQAASRAADAAHAAATRVQFFTMATMRA